MLCDAQLQFLDASQLPAAHRVILNCPLFGAYPCQAWNPDDAVIIACAELSQAHPILHSACSLTCQSPFLLDDFVGK